MSDWDGHGEEEKLIEAAREGDARAFATLMAPYQGLLYNTAYRILGDGEAAADATQETLLSVYRALDRFRGGSFKAWLLRIVTNACYDHLRRKQRRPTSSLEVLLVGTRVHRAFIESMEDPEDYVIRRDLGRIIQRGLRLLNDDQRVAIVLSDIHGLSYPEIAEITGVPVGTVKSRISRGRARLRDYLLKQDAIVPRRYLAPQPV
jgi:RNA polymerase sigma-70 factor (ECF subfamily)